MNIFEKIKSLNIDTLAEEMSNFFDCHYCPLCPVAEYCNKNNKIYSTELLLDIKPTCQQAIKNWLLSEYEEHRQL